MFEKACFCLPFVFSGLNELKLTKEAKRQLNLTQIQEKEHKWIARPLNSIIPSKTREGRRLNTPPAQPAPGRAQEAAEKTNL